MLKLILTFLLTNLWANCEQRNSGFHTIATYLKDEPQALGSRSVFLDFRVDNEKAELKGIYSPESLNGIKTINIKSNQYNCVPDNFSIEYPLANNEVKLKFSFCPTTSKGNENFFEKAIFNKEHQTLLIPTMTNLQEDASSTPNLKEQIKNFLKGKIFRGGVAARLEANDYSIKDFTFYKYQNTQMGLVVVSATSKKFNANLNYEFELVFLTLKNSIWYIADSAYIDPCISSYYEGDGYGEQSYYANRALFPNKVDPLKNFSSAWINKDDEYPHFLEFNESIYYLEFGKQLIVLPKKGKIDTINQNKDYGILTSEKIKK